MPDGKEYNKRTIAEKRMFSRSLLESDGFISLSIAARLAYLHLALCAADDGFVIAAKTTLRHIEVEDDVLSELLDGDYLIDFNDGIYLIKHWHVHNQIQKNRYTPSRHSRLLRGFRVDSTGAYRLRRSKRGDVTPSEEAEDEWSDGEDVRAEYVRYADEWERSYRTRNGLNPDLDAP